MATILFTDSEGAWKLHNAKPFPADRFQGWTMDSVPVGDVAVALANGASTMFRQRWDYGVTFELARIPSKRSSNLVVQSENLGTTWAAVNTPTRSGGAHLVSGISLDLIGDDDGAGTEGYEQTIAFTTNGTKAITAFVRQGSSTSSVIRVFDQTATADRGLIAIAWSVFPVITTAGGATDLGYELQTDGTFRVRFTAAGVLAANTNKIFLYPAQNAALSAAASTGTIYIGGVQAEDAALPTSYLYTTTAARTGITLVEIADRLRRHLLNGGTCTVYTSDVAGSSYATCSIKPGTIPQLVFSDRRAMEYTLSLQLINTAASPVQMTAQYADQ